MQFPVLCPYHNVTYQVDIEGANGSIVHTSGPHAIHWRKSGSQVTMQIREGGLRIDSHYVVNITVSTLVGKAYVSFGFSECMIVFTFPRRLLQDYYYHMVGSAT